MRHQPLARRLTVCVLTVALPSILAHCDSTAPASLAPNTMDVRVDDGRRISAIVQSFGGFQTVTTGVGEGVRVEANVAGLPLAIHIPGRPAPGV